MSDDFTQALGEVASAWPALVPPARMSVSAGATKNLRIKKPSGAFGPWDRNETPYMIRPMDLLASRKYSAVVFVGPARSGKTAALGEGWVSHAVVNDPGDMAIYQMTQEKAREYSKTRVDRMIRNSPALREMRSVVARDDNLHDKQFKNGMWLRIAWPTVANMSSSDYRYVFGTDYDRWPDDIDGEGDGWTLMGKRTQTFGSRGKVCAESSPGRVVKDPDWKPTAPHEAPPVGGILGVYNLSTRERFYWRCPHCAEPFEAAPGLGLFRLPSDDELLDGIKDIDIHKFAQQHARVACHACGAYIGFDQRATMNRAGVWLTAGLTMDALGRISGNPVKSSTAGFWLGGVAAAYQKWPELISKHLMALKSFSLTGGEQELKTTANLDQGVPYLSRLLADAGKRQGQPGVDLARERFVVPDDTRFLVASVDVQAGKSPWFSVQVHAVGADRQEWLVDRYSIKQSRREGIGDEYAPLDPAGYPEDWDLLTEKVVQATYRTSRAGVEIGVRVVVVDSGGEDGVTDKALAWYRRLKLDGIHRNVFLTKGNNRKTDWYVRKTMVGGKHEVRDVPLHLFDSFKFKDMVFAGLQRRMPGPGYLHFPPARGARHPESWVTDAFFDELNAEVRNPDGTYTQIRARNETLDHCVMIRVGISIIGADKEKFWVSPPAWALPLADNSEVVSSDVRREVAARPAMPQRRSRRSSYLS